MVDLIKRGNQAGEELGLSKQDKREVREELWWAEFYQNLYNENGNVLASEIHQGDEALSSILLKGEDEPNTSTKRGYIHSHPSGQSFSPPDLRIILIGMDPIKYFGNEPEETYPPVALMVASTDYGYFLAFPTQNTVVPTKEEARSNGLVSLTDNTEDLYRSKYRSIWENLLKTYGKNKLQKFIGNQLSIGPRDLFPEDVNDYGVDLINLVHTLELVERYNLELYFANKNSSQTELEFKKIATIEDYYPELKM